MHGNMNVKLLLFFFMTVMTLWINPGTFLTIG